MRNPVTALLTAASLLLFAGVARAEVPISDEARKHFRAGVGLMEDPDGARWEEAYRAFKAAFRASPSPKILGNLGLCAMKLERDGEALAAYRRYLAEAGAIAPAERRQIERDLQVLEASLVKLRIKTVPAWATIIDERRPVSGAPVANRYSSEESGEVTIGVRAGVHRITVKHEGFDSDSWEFEALGGQIRQHTFTLIPQADGDPPPEAAAAPTPAEEPTADEAAEGDSWTPVWIGAGVTAALGIAGGVTGGLSLANKSDFDDSLAAGDTATAQELRDDGLVLNVTTDVLLGAAIVSAAITTVLIVTHDDGDDPTAEATFTPLVGPGAAGARLRF